MPQPSVAANARTVMANDTSTRRAMVDRGRGGSVEVRGGDDPGNSGRG
jgi:hypothetical protein